MLLLGLVLAVTAPAPEHYDAAKLLEQDRQLVDISRRLADIELAYDFIENRYHGVNPYPWEQFPHKPTLRDRKKALLGARATLTANMVNEWNPD